MLVCAPSGGAGDLETLAVWVGQFYPLGQEVLGPDITEQTWDQCRHPNCIFGVDVRSIAENATYASFTVVPEPGTALMMGLGLVVVRRRRE